MNAMFGHPRRGFRRDLTTVQIETLRSISQNIFDMARVPTAYPDPRILVHAIGGLTLATSDPLWVEVDGTIVKYEWKECSRERGLAIHYGLARLAASIWAPQAVEADIWRLLALNIVPAWASEPYADAIIGAQQNAPADLVRQAVLLNAK